LGFTAAVAKGKASPETMHIITRDQSSHHDVAHCLPSASATLGDPTIL
jgi:hypothetical protein